MCQQRDGAMVYVLHPAGKRVIEASVSGFLSRRQRRQDQANNTEAAYRLLSLAILFGVAVPIPGGIGNLVKEQKCRQKDSKPSFFVARGEKGVETSKHFGHEPFVNALASNAVELSDDHTWNRYSAGKGMAVSESRAHA